jgi:hypothetical protein
VRPASPRRDTGGRAPDAARELDDVYLVLLRREADGGWCISHLMWHPAARPD